MAMSPDDSLIENEFPSPTGIDVTFTSHVEKRERPRSRQAYGTEIIYSNVNFTIPMKVKGQRIKKHVLKDCSGVLNTGLNAILGPTGSGKTTLLNVLAGRIDNKSLTGDVLVNGERQSRDFRLISGFVVQDEVIMGTLSVRENLHFSAALRLPKKFKYQDREARVEMIINDLGLTTCSETRVGNDERRGISGGERKRTSIGMELITSPDVLFLDEPTTGLDASTACSVIQLLGRQAQKGRTIIFSIHQPRYSIFKLFDYLTLMSAGGIVYNGPCSKSIDYFSSLGHVCEMYNNPADFYMDVISEDEVKSNENNGITFGPPHTTLAEYFQESSNYKDDILKIQPVVNALSNGENVIKQHKLSYQASFFKQTYYVCRRTATNLIRDPRALSTQLVLNLFYAVVIGGIYYKIGHGPEGLGDRVGAFFFLTMNMVFMNMSAVALFIKERPVFKHESANGYYRVSSYFVAKVFCDILPMRVFPLLIFSAITYFMMGLKLKVDHFFIYTLTLLLTSLSAASLCILVSSTVNLLAVANMLVSLPFVFMMLFSGSLINLNKLTKYLKWLKYLSIFKYGLSSLEIIELKGLAFHSCGKHKNQTCQSGDDYLEFQGIPVDDLWINEAALGAITVGFLFLSYVQLRRMKKIV